MICFKLRNFQTSLKKSLFLFVKKTILKYKIVSKFLASINLLNLLNHNVLNFNLKRYFKLIYKTLKHKKIVFLTNGEYGFTKLSLKSSPVLKKKPNLLIFLKNKQINLSGECRRYNIPILDFYTKV